MSKVQTLDIAAASAEAESVQSAPAAPGVQIILAVGAGDKAEGVQVILLLRAETGGQAGDQARDQAGDQAESAEVRGNERSVIGSGLNMCRGRTHAPGQCGCQKLL